MTAIPHNDRIAELIYADYEANRDAPRQHLGASLLGHPCARYLWLTFHWAIKESFSGRILRLFERGQREEEIIVKNLRAIGIEIYNTCLDKDGQCHVDFGNHVAGSVDGIIESGVPEAPKTRHIAEFKTHSLKSFTDLKAKGVKESKFQHYVQMQCYMHGTGIKRALYVAVCKDNDEIYTERVEYKQDTAEYFINRGHQIVSSDSMPPMMRGASPSWYQCKFCPCYDFCHVSHICTEINCRTCAKFTVCPDGRFKCEYLPVYLSPEEQTNADGECEFHTMHPDLVPLWLFQGAVSNSGIRYNINGNVVINGGEKGQIQTRELLNGIYTTVDEENIPF